MKLYQEIIFLQYNSPEGQKWVVENVKPYYQTLIKPSVELQRHLLWCNFEIPIKNFTQSKLRSAQISDLQDYLGMDISQFKIQNKRQILRNCLHPQIGEYIFNLAQNNVLIKNTEQFKLI